MARSNFLFSKDNHPLRLSYPLAPVHACPENAFISAFSHRVNSFVGQSASWLCYAIGDSVLSALVLGALIILIILIIFLMFSIKYWQPSTSAHSPDSSAPSSIGKEYKSEYGQMGKTRQGRRRTWWLVLAIATLLFGLVLGLSLGLTLGREHNSQGKDTTLSATVDLGYSRYQGNSYSAGVSQWLGIRYAAPPIGDLRFAAPHDPAEDRALQKANKVR